MSFILVPRSGGDNIQVNAWNWRPTIAFLLSENVINEETHERFGTHGCIALADADLALRMAKAVERKLQAMRSDERIRADLSVTNEPKKLARFDKPETIDANDVYSAKYEWLVQFVAFCKRSEGFEVR